MTGVRRTYLPLCLVFCLAFSLALGRVLSAEPGWAQEPKARIDEITFTGLKALKEKQLKEVMETRLPPSWKIWESYPPLDKATLARDKAAIERLYKAWGFYSAQIELTTSLRGERAKLAIEVKEGRPVIISRVVLIIDPRDDDLKAFLLNLPPDIKFGPGKIFRLGEYIKVKARIMNYLASVGQPKADLKARVDVSASEGWATVKFNLKPGPKLKFGPPVLSGSIKTKPWVIRRLVAWQPGQEYDIALVKETRARLRRLGVFSSISLNPMLDQIDGDRVPVLIQVKERSIYSLTVGLGYGNEDSFRGSLTGTMRSRMGWSETISGTLHYSRRSSGGLLDLRQPNFMRLNQDLGLRLGLREREFVSYSNTRTYFQAALDRPLAGPFKLSLSYTFEINDPFDIEVAGDAAEADRNYIVSAPGVGIVLDRRNDILNPTQGYLVNLRGEAAHALTGSQVDYLLLESNASQYLSPYNWLTLGFRIRVAALSRLGSDKIPIFKRLFTGGGTTVRGYPYQKLGPVDSGGNPKGGLSLIEASAEARVPIWEELQGVVFVDMGHLVEDAWSFDPAQLRFTTGLGLRYNTIIGPVRADMGWELNPPSDANFNRLQFHFTIGQAF